MKGAAMDSRRARKFAVFAAAALVSGLAYAAKVTRDSSSLRGEIGRLGDIGLAGPTGATGASGTSGATGDTGPTGVSGVFAITAGTGLSGGAVSGAGAFAIAQGGVGSSELAAAAKSLTCEVKTGIAFSLNNGIGTTATSVFCNAGDTAVSGEIAWYESNCSTPRSALSVNGLAHHSNPLGTPPTDRWQAYVYNGSGSTACGQMWVMCCRLQ